MKRPALLWYVGDWLRDQGVRSVTFAARGLWMDMLCLMYQSEPVGHLRLSGRPVTTAELAGMTGSNEAQVKALIGELARPQVGQHREQLSHNTGWVAAATRAIGQAIAGQTIRVGRRLAVDVARESFRRTWEKGFVTWRDRGQPVRVKEFERAWEYSRRWLEKVLPEFLRKDVEGIEVIQDHALLRVLERPNPIMVGWALLYMTVISLELTGKGYWLMNPAAKTIWPLPADWVEPVHDGGLFTSWRVRQRNVAQTISLDGPEIAYMYYPDAGDPLLGAFSPLQATARAVVADEALQDSQARAFERGIFPGVLIEVGRHPDLQGQPGQRPMLTEAQRNQLVTWIKKMYRGYLNSDEPLILDAMIEDVRAMTNKPKEMDFLNSGKQTKERVTQSFGTNPLVMGQIEGGNRAQAIAAKQTFYDATVNPKIDLISQYLSARVAPRFSGGDTSLVLWIDRAQANDPDLVRSACDLLARYGAATKDELRSELLDWAPMAEGGDEIARPQGGFPTEVAGQTGWPFRAEKPGGP